MELIEQRSSSACDNIVASRLSEGFDESAASLEVQNPKLVLGSVETATTVLPKNIDRMPTYGCASRLDALTSSRLRSLSSAGGSGAVQDQASLGSTMLSRELAVVRISSSLPACNRSSGRCPSRRSLGLSMKTTCMSGSWSPNIDGTLRGQQLCGCPRTAKPGVLIESLAMPMSFARDSLG